MRILLAVAALALVAWAGLGGPIVVASVAGAAVVVGFGRWLFVTNENRGRIWWSRRGHAVAAAVVAAVAIWAAADASHRLGAGVAVGGVLLLDVAGGLAYSWQHADWNWDASRASISL